MAGAWYDATMCGRFTLSATTQVLARQFQLTVPIPLEPRFNIAPTQQVPVVRMAPEKAQRELALLRWGLVPSWAKDLRLGARLINARAETVGEKPAFRASFRRRRCLVPADGFYEWQPVDPKQKQPHYIRRRDGGLFAFAGLWDRWEGTDGKIIDSFTVLTTEANELLRTMHERMPVIVGPEDYELWLDPAVHDAERLQPLLRPYPAAEMAAYPVGPGVNSPKKDDPQCVAPLS